MEFTGERFIPGRGDAQIAYEHLLRYLFAKEAAVGRVVLDLGSGEGYGSFLLAQGARKVIGIELSPEAVVHASSRYVATNLSFVVGSALDVPLASHTVEVVVCFEVIEHVPDPERLVVEASRVLRGDGLFLVSTPNKKTYSDDPNTKNPFHIKEFYFAEFRQLLRRYFRHAILYGQRISYGASLWNLSPTAKASAIGEITVKAVTDGLMPVRMAKPTWQEPRYFVAVCSKGVLPQRVRYRSVYLSDQAHMMSAEFDAAHAQWQRDSEAVRRELDHATAAASVERASWQEQAELAGREQARLQSLLQNLETERAALQRSAEALAVERTSWQGQAEAAGREQARLQSLLQNLETERAALQHSAEALAVERTSWQEQAEAAGGEQARLVTNLRDLETQRAEFQHTIEAVTTAHNQLQRQLQDIHGSVAWKLIIRYRRVVDRFLPIGTLQGRIYRQFIRDITAAFRVARTTRGGLLTFPFHLLERLSASGRLLWRDLLRREKRLPGGQTIQVDRVTPPTHLSCHLASVDIIVCVHNALDDVRRCLDSIARHTSPPYRLILVDDGSGDATRAFLVSFTQENGALLLRNEHPLGYTRAANQGLRSSAADYIILLNSDTVVTAHWLDRLVACAESKPIIGLVGPLSNTASWQSIPEIELHGDWAANPLPAGFSIDDMARLVARCSAQLYPPIPFLNGFCLLIRRQVLKRIGLFDESTFGPGYHEENDFCLRARKDGWALAVADDTFVYHAQSRSYSTEKRIHLSNQGMVALAQKHGHQIIEEGVAVCRWDRVLEGIRARSRVMFARHALLESGRTKFAGRRLLFLLPIATPVGGGNVVLTEVSTMHAMGLEVAIFNLNAHRARFRQYHPDLEIPILFGEPEDVIALAAGYDAVVATAWQSVEWMSGIHHREGVRGYYVQDFEPYFYPPGTEKFKQAHRSYSALPELVQFTKTPWTREEVRHQTGLDCAVVGASVDIDLFRPRPRRRPDGQDRKIRVAAMIRPETAYRAPRLTMELLRRAFLHYGNRIEVLLFGTEASNPEFTALPRDFPWLLAGVLTQQQIARLLNEVDIFVDFSEHQAMGLTALEAMACGVAVIVPVRGGSGSFARQEENALIVDTTSHEACWQALVRLIEDDGLRHRLQRQALIDACECYPERAAFNILATLFAGRPAPPLAGEGPGKGSTPHSKSEDECRSKMEACPPIRGESPLMDGSSQPAVRLARLAKDSHSTIEFYVPGQGLNFQQYMNGPDICGLHHLARYEWASAVLADYGATHILDIACGAGYGSYLLASRLPYAVITGCDYDPRAKVFAEENYKCPNVTFRIGNIETWIVEPGAPIGTFNAIVSFDTIEHLLHRELALLNLADNLSDDGILLLSTPCHTESILNPEWEHHRIEYSCNVLVRLMRRFFSVVIEPSDLNFPGRDFWTQIVNKDVIRYSNAANPLVCLRPIRR